MAERLRRFICDLHVHIGRTLKNKPVKITAARDLTFANIAKECVERKGVHVVGIIDCASPAVIEDICALLRCGEMVEQEGGGLRYRDQVTVLLGSELETTERTSDGGTRKLPGESHQISYFRNLDELLAFSAALSRHVTNLDLSSQRCRLSAQELFELVHRLGGFLVPAHSFTPHKGIYGSCCARLTEIFDSSALAAIPAVELGLSADTDLADRISELAHYTFLTNSDAHSLPKIAREYNVVEMSVATFDELFMALRREGGRRVVANYGLDPRLGKYHRTHCEECEHIQLAPPPLFVCERCGSAKVTRGVLDRIVEIQDYGAPLHPDHRPPYQFQVPLQFVPKVGAVTLNKLINRFGSEMAVLHDTSGDALTQVVGREVAESILRARAGTVRIQAGGGGKYGKAVTSDAETQLELALGEVSTGRLP